MRKTFTAALLGTAALGLALGVTPAAAQDIGAVFSFGDSLADPGNIPSLTGGANFPPPPYVGNRFSNGPVIPEYLDDLLGARTGANLAVGGAFSGQIPGFGGNSNAANPGLGTLVATDTVSQATRFAASGGRIGEGDVTYIFGSGPNDYFLAIRQITGNGTITPTQADVLTAVNTFVTRAQDNNVQAARILSGVGAQRFVLATLPNFGTIPQFSSSAGAATLAGTFSSAHNATLIDAANRISGFADVTLVDYESLFAAVQANPSAFGFLNATAPCLAVAACAGGTLAEQNQFFFFDGVHPTTAGHAIAAAATADAIQAPYQAGAVVESEELTAGAFARDLLDRAGATFRAPEFRSADLPDVAIEESVVHYGAIAVSGGYERIDFDRKADIAAAGFDSETNRFSLTGAYDASGLRFGATLAYDDTDLTAGQTEGDVRSYRGGLFAGVVHGFSPFVNLYASGALQVGYTDYDLSRDTRIAGFRANADTDGWTVGLGGELRLTQRLLDSLEIGPVARLGFVDVDIDGYTETGAPAGVNRVVEDISRHYAYGEIGLGLTHSFAAGFGAVDVSLAALYHDDFGDDGTRINSRAATLTGFTSSIEAGGDRSGSVRIEGDIDIVTARGLTIGLDGDATFGDDLDGYSIGASLGYRF